MIVNIKYKNEWHDISNWVDPFDNWFEKTISDNFSSGKITLKAIRKNAAEWIDLSKRFPSYVLVRIDNERGTNRLYYTGDCHKEEIVPDKIYSHEINLIDLKKILELKTLPDCTITQPKTGVRFGGGAPRIVYKLSNNNLNGVIYKYQSDKCYIESGEFVTDKGFQSTGVNEGIPFYVGDNPDYDSLKEQELSLDIEQEYNTSGVFNNTQILVPGSYSIDIETTVINPAFTSMISKYYGKGGVGTNGKPKLNVGYQLGNGNRKYLGSDDIEYQTPNYIELDSEPVSILEDRYYLKGLIETKPYTFKRSDVIRIDNPTEFRLFMKNDRTFVNDDWWSSFLILNRLLLPPSVQSYKQMPLFYVTETKVTIQKDDIDYDEDNLLIRLSDALLKVLRLSELNIKVSDTTLAELSKYGSPEFTWSKYTVLGALEEIGGVCGSKPRIIEQDDGDLELVYDFLSDMESYEVVDPSNITSITDGRDFENYVSSLELNAENVVMPDRFQITPHSEDYLFNTPKQAIRTDWLSLRADSDDNAVITALNLGLRLPHKIDYIQDVEIKGVDLHAMESSLPSEYNAEYIWHLNDPDTENDSLRIVEESFYNTLLGSNDYSNLTDRKVLSQNNVLYYTQGDNRIKGMCFLAGFEPDVLGVDAGNRSIYETLFVKALIKSNASLPYNNTLKDTGGLADEIKIRVTYIPQFSTRATVWKEDLSGFERKNLTKYYNETANVNDMAVLGSSAQNSLNRLGNTQIVISGYVTTEKLPDVGSKTSENYILTSIRVNETPKRSYYTATYVKDFSIIVDYVGIKSPHRQYEIPPNSLVNRIDKQRTHVLLHTTTPKYKTVLDSPSPWLPMALQYFFMFNSEKGTAPLFVHNFIYKRKVDSVSYVLPGNNICTLKLNNLYGVVRNVNFTNPTPEWIALHPEFEGKIIGIINKNSSLMNNTRIVALDETLSDTDFQYFTNAREFFNYVKSGNDVQMIFNDGSIDTYLQNPILITPSGNTLTYSWSMLNNHSAGQKKKTVLGKLVQQDVQYTDNFGRLGRICSRLVQDIDKDYPSSDSALIKVLDDYPEISAETVQAVQHYYAEFDYIVNKDAREILGGSYEVSFHSNDVDDIILFQGFTKYNPMSLYALDNVSWKMAIMNDDYLISKSATRVDVTRLQTVDGEIISNVSTDWLNKRIGYVVYSDGVGENYIQFNTPVLARGKGIVVYEENTKELIMMLVRPIDGTESHRVNFTEINLND